MRDKNSTLKQFNIQLSNQVKKILARREFVSHNPCLEKSVPPDCRSKEIKVELPRSFRMLRSLAIAVWYFPESIHWLVRMEMDQRSFSHLNRKQRIILKILLTSKEIMVSYLFFTQTLHRDEIFGNLLNNDLQDALRYLKIREVFPRRPAPKIWRRGFRDGKATSLNSTRPEKFDWSFNEYQNVIEKKRILQTKTYNFMVKKLRELVSDSEEV